jgi:3-keto-disaccharide hydrolase
MRVLATAFLVTSLFIARGIAADGAVPGTLTDAEQTAGWKLLFDGKTTTGWRNYQKPDIASGWKVENGELVRGAEKAGDIVTTDKYAAFELSLEYNISPGGNSGLMFHVTEDGKQPWNSGPEIQIQDTTSAAKDPQKPGWLYQLYKSDVDAAKPAGEWNELRLLITPQKCATWMNGQLYYEYVIGSEDWNERVAKSKFAKFPEFGKATSGYICLQDHGNPVKFRNIKIRVIGQ